MSTESNMGATARFFQKDNEICFDDGNGRIKILFILTDTGPIFTGTVDEMNWLIRSAAGFHKKPFQFDNVGSRNENRNNSQ